MEFSPKNILIQLFLGTYIIYDYGETVKKKLICNQNTKYFFPQNMSLKLETLILRLIATIMSSQSTNSVDAINKMTIFNL